MMPGDAPWERARSARALSPDPPPAIRRLPVRPRTPSYREECGPRSAGKGRQDARSRGVRNGWAAAAWALGRPDLLACFGTHGTPTAFVSLHHPSCRRAPGPSPFAASAVDARPQRHHPLDASACPATLSSRRPRGTISGTPIPAPRGLRFRPPVGHAAPRSVWKFEAWTYTLDNTCFSPELAGAA